MEKLSFIAMNLQLFAEDGGGLGGPAPQVSEGTGVATDGATGTEGSQGPEGSASTVTDPPSQLKQSPEQNAKFAEMRVTLTAAEKRAQEAEQALAQRDKWVADRYGKQGITTWDQYQSALVEQERQQMEQGWKEKGYDPAQIREIMKQDPEYQKLIQTAKVQAEQLSQQQGKEALNAEIAELVGEYPDLKVKTLEDLKTLPNFEGILAKAQKGYSILDAYESVNKSEIRKRQSEAARQATLNSVQGKSHLKGNGQGTEADTTIIPDDVLEMYKKFNPGKSMDEYKAHYKKSLGK